VLDTDIEVNENLAIPGVFNPALIAGGYPVERITINNADCRNLENADPDVSPPRRVLPNTVDG